MRFQRYALRGVRLYYGFKIHGKVLDTDRTSILHAKIGGHDILNVER